MLTAFQPACMFLLRSRCSLCGSAFDNAVGLPRRLNFFLTLYCIGYVTVTMSFRLVEVTTGNLMFKNLVGLINAFAILSIVLPFMYFGKKLLRALGALSDKGDKFDADADAANAAKPKNTAKLRLLTFRILKIANIMIFSLVMVTVFHVTASNFYPWPWWTQTILHRVVELTLVKYAMDMLSASKKGGGGKKVRPETAVSHAAVTVAESDIAGHTQGSDGGGDAEDAGLRSTVATDAAISSGQAGSTVVSLGAGSTGFTTAASSVNSTAVGGSTD